MADYVKLVDGVPQPYSLAQLRSDEPDVSFPVTPNPSSLERYDVFPLVDGEKPDAQVVEKGPIEFQEPNWVQTYTGRPFNEQELAEQKEQTDRRLKREAQEKASDIVFREQVAPKLDTLPDEEVAVLAYLYEEWDPNGVSYEVDDVVRVGDIPYRVVQAHTSQADFAPSLTPALFTPLRTVSGPNPDPWVQPTGAQDAYAIGDLVTHPNPNDSGTIWVYESVIDANTTVPGQNGDQFWIPVRVA